MLRRVDRQVSSWLSILEASGLVLLLPPYHRNYNKHLVKTLKLYRLDSGLLCYLLRIGSAAALLEHPFRGTVLENRGTRRVDHEIRADPCLEQLYQLSTGICCPSGTCITI